VVCRSVCHDCQLCKNGWTDRDAVCNVDLVGSKKARIVWGCTLAPAGEYDWTVRVRRGCCVFVKLLWPLVTPCHWLDVSLRDVIVRQHNGRPENEWAFSRLHQAECKRCAEVQGTRCFRCLFVIGVQHGGKILDSRGLPTDFHNWTAYGVKTEGGCGGCATPAGRVCHVHDPSGALVLLPVPPRSARVSVERIYENRSSRTAGFESAATCESGSSPPTRTTEKLYAANVDLGIDRAAENHHHLYLANERW